MARGKRRAQHHEASPKPAFDSPFKSLKKMIASQPKRVAPPAAAPAPAEPEPHDEEQLLAAALAGVVPLPGPRPVPSAPQTLAINHAIVSEEAEVLAQLSDLVAGQGDFDITETEDYVEGARAGLDPRLIIRLRRGEFAVEAHLDLHGMVQTAAKEALSAFIQDAVRQGRRTVLVVHGKGLGSPGGRPVLKHATVGWLSHGLLSGHVLAFVTARPTDGGTGALYVLLQRKRRRAVFDVLNGAKRYS